MARSFSSERFRLSSSGVDSAASLPPCLLASEVSGSNNANSFSSARSSAWG
jgi:hypothetical protein